MVGLVLAPRKTPGKDIVLYVVAEGGVATVEQGGGDNPAIALLTMLGNAPPAEVVVNELTTVASAFTAAQFINGEAISGNPLGLRIAAGNVPNLVDPVTGGWGKVILDPLNSTQTTTLANLEHAGLADHRLRHRGQRRLARPLPQGRHPSRRSDAQEHTRGDGRHRPRAVGKRERTLRVVRRSLPTTERRWNGARHPSRRISPTSRKTSPSVFASRAAETTPLAGSCSMRRATCGAARTGCRARSPASFTTLVAARSSSPPTGRRSRRRSPASPAWALTASAGAPAWRSTKSGSRASTARSA